MNLRCTDPPQAVSVGTIGQPPKKPASYQQKSNQQSINMGGGNSNVSAPNSANVTGNFNAGNPVNVHSHNSGIAASVYTSVPATPYSNANVGNSLYNNASAAVRPKTTPTGGKTTSELNLNRARTFMHFC